MYRIVNEFPNDFLLEGKGDGYISIYQSTHRHSPENKQDLIRYKNQLGILEESLKEKYSKREIEPILKDFKDLEEDKEFWNNTLDGLAIFYGGGEMLIYKLKRPVKDLVVVSDSFHIKPLIRIYQSADRYQLLAISKGSFSLYEGNRYELDKLDLGSSPTSLEEVIGSEKTEAYLTSGTYGGAKASGVFHGHGGRSDEVDKDREKFFRYIDKYVYENFSNKDRVPLVLVGLDENQGAFRGLSKNPYLLDKGINKDFEALSIDELREGLWEELEESYLERTEKLVKDFNNLRAGDKASSDLSQLVRAGLENRIKTLLIESDRIIPGRIIPEEMSYEEGDLNNPDTDDLLDDLGEMVLRNGGEVIVLPKDRMPSDTGLAGVYRY